MRSQNYDPFGSMALSALMAVIPVIVLLGAVEIFEARALMGLFVALLIAVFALDLLPATGASILIAAILIRLIPRLQRVGTRPDVCENTVSHSLFVFGDLLRGGDLLHYKIRRYGRGLGLALAGTGWAYPFFGTKIGWLGVGVTGSDTSSNVLFGGLRRATSEQLVLSPVLMVGANSAGGVWEKMIKAQSIVAASTATRWCGNEGSVLRYVFCHSIALAVLVGLFVMSQAYPWPFKLLVP